MPIMIKLNKKKERINEKKGKIWIMCMLIALSSQLYSQDIADVSATDRSYNAIKNSVKKGYISLYAETIHLQIKT